MDDEAHAQWLDHCIEVIQEILHETDGKIYLRQRQKKQGRQGQYEKLNDEEEFFIAEEAGLKFKVNLTDYLDTGLFLDHRITRGMVRELAAGKSVLNLFCYTGSFSVYAASGGAANIVSIDLSKTYLEWAEDNMRLNNLYDSKRHQFVHADVKQWLNTLRPDTFDLVILDPPTFSNSKRMKDFLDIQRDHVELLNKTLYGMKKDGVIFFSTNYRKFQLMEKEIECTSIRDITNATTPFDFQGKLFRWCFRMIK